MRATTIDTRPFERSHWSKPSPSTYGIWWFRNTDTGTEHSATGTYTDVVHDLAPGNWIVLP